jgi:hypothetical protein
MEVESTSETLYFLTKTRRCKMSNISLSLITLTPWSRVPLAKPGLTQPYKNFPTFDGDWKYTLVFTRAFNLFLYFF